MVGFNLSTASNMLKMKGTFLLIQQAMEDDAYKEIYDITKKILSQAKINAPVKTGALRASGRIENIGTRKNPDFRILFGGINDVDYAGFQEFGTVFFAGRFFLTRAVDKYRPKYVGAVKGALEGGWNREVRKHNAIGMISF